MGVGLVEERGGKIKLRKDGGGVEEGTLEMIQCWEGLSVGKGRVLGRVECGEGLSVGKGRVLGRVECWEGLSVGKG